MLETEAGADEGCGGRSDSVNPAPEHQRCCFMGLLQLQTL